MHAAIKKSAPTALLLLAAATLTGCVVAPAQPYSGGEYYSGSEYYAEPAPVYVAPRYYYGGSRWTYWHRNHWRGHGNHWH